MKDKIQINTAGHVNDNGLVYRMYNELSKFNRKTKFQLKI